MGYYRKYIETHPDSRYCLYFCARSRLPATDENCRKCRFLKYKADYVEEDKKDV